MKSTDAGTILLYLVTAACFILGIKFLGSPKTARRGNQIAAFGMLVGLVTTGVTQTGISWGYVIPTIVVGAVIGAVASRAVRMTAMPQMVAMFNGMGAGAAALIGIADYRDSGGAPETAVLVAVLLSCLIGSLSFTGSAVAFGKLQGIISGRAITFPFQKPFNGLLFLIILALGITQVAGVHSGVIFTVFVLLALLLGVLFVIPVGGADMPVIVSLLNSFTGTAAAMAGFVLGNYMLIVAGAIVGASGFILTQLMSKAMNRSLFNVLFAGVGATSGAVAAGADDRPIHSASADDLAPILAYAQQVVIVPGYGLAVARAQHDVKELGDELEKRGVTVKYGIHPVAGRMPGHMNVLLAEADVPYSQLKEMDEINPEMSRTDVAIVIGANDVVNPAAKDQPGSPIYGMPIINVDEAKTVVVMKRSMASGFAGIDNPLFYEPKTLMYFGDAHESVGKLLAAVKEQ